MDKLKGLNLVGNQVDRIEKAEVITEAAEGTTQGRVAKLSPAPIDANDLFFRSYVDPTTQRIDGRGNGIKVYRYLENGIYEAETAIPGFLPDTFLKVYFRIGNGAVKWWVFFSYLARQWFDTDPEIKSDVDALLQKFGSDFERGVRELDRSNGPDDNGGSRH